MKLDLLALLPLAAASPLALQKSLHDIQFTPKITSVTATGHGCPQGDFTILVDSDNSAKVSFDLFNILAGHWLPVHDQTRNCQVSATISFPGACKRAVMKTRTDAYVLVAKDEAATTAKVSTQFSIIGGSIGGSPPDLAYTSKKGRSTEDDIGHTWDIPISASETKATFVAHLGIFLNATNAKATSHVVVDGFGFLVSQEGVC
jgi:hypothetical protein